MTDASDTPHGTDGTPASAGISLETAARAR